MAKYSMKMGGKEVGPASVYAPPHTATGTTGTTAWKDNGYGVDNHMSPSDLSTSIGSLRSKGYTAPKTSGIEMRGAGAATKGRMCRGPMA